MSFSKTISYLSENILQLRRKKNLTQTQLAQLADIPRSTLTYIESGSGNPSLNNLLKVSQALGVGVEELLSRPRSSANLLASSDIPVLQRGAVKIEKLLPERVKGVEIDKMHFKGRSHLPGKPHLAGTREYLHVLTGEVTVHVSGEAYQVEAGSVLCFDGAQPHSYRNPGSARAVAMSVVIPVLSMAGR